MMEAVIQQIFAMVNKDGKTVVTGNRDTEREGTYVRGTKATISTTTLESAGYVLQTIDTRTTYMSLAADVADRNSALKISKAGTVVFEATRYDGGETKKFGAEERYLGTDYRPAGEWVVTQGAIPVELELVPA